MERYKEQMAEMEEEYMAKLLNASTLQHKLLETKNREIEALKKQLNEQFNTQIG